MRNGKLLSKTGKNFFGYLFGIMSVYLLVVFVNIDVPRDSIVAVVLPSLIMYVAAYAVGFGAGRESLLNVADFVKPGLRWKVLDKENDMFDREDKEYEGKH